MLSGALDHTVALALASSLLHIAALPSLTDDSDPTCRQIIIIINNLAVKQPTSLPSMTQPQAGARSATGPTLERDAESVAVGAGAINPPCGAGAINPPCGAGAINPPPCGATVKVWEEGGQDGCLESTTPEAFRLQTAKQPNSAAAGSHFDIAIGPIHRRPTGPNLKPPHGAGRYFFFNV